MNLKLILTRGLPASGKTTWAKEYIQKNIQTINLCKDDLRLQMADTKKRENQVIRNRDLLTENYLSEDYSVIWSDTNLNPIHRTRATEIAAKYSAELVIKDFTHVSLAECIKRDLLRFNSVGQQVIYKMYYDYLEQPQPAQAASPDRLNCYLVDVDGTVAINTTRPPFDWHRVSEDSPNLPVIQLVQQLSQTNKIIIMSGRSDICRELTQQWLDRYQIPHHEVLMRSANDQRPDELIKLELYHTHVLGNYNILGVVDDRPKVCRMWRRLGLSVFQVGNPDYEF